VPGRTGEAPPTGRAGRKPGHPVGARTRAGCESGRNVGCGAGQRGGPGDGSRQRRGPGPAGRPAVHNAASRPDEPPRGRQQRVAQADRGAPGAPSSSRPKPRQEVAGPADRHQPGVVGGEPVDGRWAKPLPLRSRILCSHRPRPRYRAFRNAMAGSGRLMRERGQRWPWTALRSTGPPDPGTGCRREARSGFPAHPLRSTYDVRSATSPSHARPSHPR
jgi:hypothetical protein